MTRSANPPNAPRRRLEPSQLHGSGPSPPAPTNPPSSHSNKHEQSQDSVMSEDFDDEFAVPGSQSDSLVPTTEADAIAIVERILYNREEDSEMSGDGIRQLSGNEDAEEAGNVSAESDVNESEPEKEPDYREGLFDDGYGEDNSADISPDHQPSSATPPAMRRSSIAFVDQTSEVPHKPKPCTMTKFRAAINLYVNKYSVTREQWVDFRDMLHTLEDVPDEIKALPARVDTIKENLDSQLPLITMRTRSLDLDVNLLQTRSGQNPKRLKEEIGLFDIKAFFQRLLQADDIMRRVHIGLAEIVDQPTEFWHSDSWGASIRTTSGVFARVQDGQYKGNVIFPSDFVWYNVAAQGHRAIGRVTFVGVDKREAAKSDGSFGKMKLRLQPLYVRSNLNDHHWEKLDATPLANGVQELILVENAPPVYIMEGQLICNTDHVTLDYNFGTTTLSKVNTKRYLVRHVLNFKTDTVRVLALSHPIRAELEIVEFRRNGHDRASIIKELDGSTKVVRSLPYTLFIDAFGLYRNMYRPIPGFYAQFAFMNEFDRKKRINVFPITLAPFAAKWDDVIASLIHLTELETGVDVVLDDGTSVTICAPCITYVGDMPQQQANAGCKNQKADHFCRSCLISAAGDANNIRYDIVNGGRYHFETLRVREMVQAMSKKDMISSFKELGLSEQPSPLAALTPSLCIPLAFPGDVAHSEFKGIARQVLNLLFSDIIKKSFHEAFAQSFAKTPPSPGWATIQNIHRYIGSFSMQEFGRAIMIAPITLRKWLTDIRVRPKYLSAIEIHIESERCTYSGDFGDVNFVVHCYATIARLNAIIMAQHIRAQDREHIEELIIESRERMQDLLDIAVIAATSTRAPSDSPDATHKPRRRQSRVLTSGKSQSCSASPLSRVSNASDESGDEAEPEESDAEASDARFGDEEELLEFEVGAAKGKGRNITKAEREKKRIDVLQRKKFTPNVHTIRHVMDTIQEYGSARNVTTWSGEDRHK
jgi:hypothetical protein